MRDRGKDAREAFLSGYNCTQAVLKAYEDFLPEGERDAVVDMASSFGGGMGRLREVCGTVSGAFLIIGRIWGYHTPGDNTRKKELYSHIQSFASRFESECGSIVCRDLLGLGKGERGGAPEERDAAYYKRRPCPMYCDAAASILGTYLKENGILGDDGERI